MPINVLMPALSPTMEEGTLAKWLVKEGDTVTSGAILAEIETDKATMEFEAVDEGTVGKIVVPEGTENVKVNELIAILLEEGENSDSLEAAASQPKPANESAPAAEGGSGEKVSPSAQTTTPPNDKGGSGSRVFASPLARRIAAERGIDLGSIQGSGPHGRIVKADVEAAQVGTRKAGAEAPQVVAPTPARPEAVPSTAAPNTDQVRSMFAGREFEEIKLDGMRRTIAVRLAEAKQTIPHFYLRREIRLDALLKFRSQLNRELEARGVKLSVNDFVIKASAVALQQVPDCNAVWAGDRILKLKSSDVAVAVAIEGGLFTPVIRDAHQKTLSALSAEMKDLAARARSRKLAPQEYQGGSFAISNLGMYGIESFDAVINPPHGSILAVGAGLKKPVVNDQGEVQVATVLVASLSVDHRVIDGALGARFLEALKSNLEQPISMLA